MDRPSGPMHVRLLYKPCTAAYLQSIDVKVGVHQGSVLSCLIFIIVLETISKEFRTGCPWDLFYADDLVIDPYLFDLFGVTLFQTEIEHVPSKNNEIHQKPL